MKFILNIISGLISITVILSCGVEKIEQGDLIKKQGVEHSPEIGSGILSIIIFLLTEFFQSSSC